MKDGKVFAVTIYPRAVTRELIRRAAKKNKVSVSRFVLLAAIREAVGPGDDALRKALPVHEYDTLVLNKYGANV